MCESAAGSLSRTVVGFPVLASPASIAGIPGGGPSPSPPARVSAPTTTTKGANEMTDEQLRNLSAKVQYQRTINTVTTQGEDSGGLIVHGLAYNITDPAQDRSQVWVTHVTPIVDGKCDVDFDINMTADEAEVLARQLTQAAFLARLHNQLHRDELRAEAAVLSDADK